MTLIDQIRDLIAEGETQRSLDELYKYVKESNADVIDHLVMLRSRMQNLQRSVSNGTMDEQDAALERAKINEAILKLLPQLTPEYLAEASKRKETAQRPAPVAATSTSSQAPVASGTNMKMIYMIGGGVLALILLILALSGGGDSENQEIAADPVTELPNTQSQANQEQNFQQAAPTGAEDLSAEWQSNDGAVTFVTEDGTNWDELDKGGTARFKFTTQDETEQYVEIYDASRQMTLRIFDTHVKFLQDGEWHVMAQGGWAE